MRNVSLVFVAAGLAACQAPSEPPSAIAERLTAQWVSAYNSANVAELVDLYGAEAFLHMPNSPTLSGKPDIQGYWTSDIGDGSVRTEVELHNAYMRDGLLYVEGDYRVVDSRDQQLIAGDFIQLWGREGSDWKITSDNWHAHDPELGSQPGLELADRLTATWTGAYNGADSAALAALYEDGAKLTMPGEETLTGREDIEAFWQHDLGDGQVATELMLTDTYVAGDLAHIEGAYRVTDTATAGAQLGGGEYLQLWVREGNDWRIHREMWSATVSTE
ncbi:MAG TPA: DUF4440 domain-containing protein [Gammaproteobacteria bacterium]|nr:DUF4440 domain-containing protein [Gammaproteobacteria bacterium]